METKNKQDANGHQNSVTLQGLAYSCLLLEGGQGQMQARIELQTATLRKDASGKAEYDNWLRHRVIVNASNLKTIRGLMSLAEKCKANAEGYGKKGFKPVKIPVAVKGALAANDRGEPQYVAVTEDNLEFPKQLKMKNKMSLSGTLVETTYNDLYATALLQSTAVDGKPMMLPMVIYSQHNPQQWANLKDGKVAKGETLAVTGPLISKVYGGNEKEIFRVSVNAAEYTLPARRKTQRQGAEHKM